MQPLKCEVRAMRAEDRSMLFFLAEENLHPLAEKAGHGERYRTDELLALLDRATVFVAECDHEIAGFVVVEDDGSALAIRSLCVNPAFEARSVAHLLVEWAEGAAFGRELGRLEAFIPADDERSLRLYRKHDFVGRPAADDPETIVLEKRLPSVEARENTV
jgi:GNAT superfamily N-acetyltransferase